MGLEGSLVNYVTARPKAPPSHGAEPKSGQVRENVLFLQNLFCLVARLRPAAGSWRSNCRYSVVSIEKGATSRQTDTIPGRAN
jgi:hypothetical protein